jgi:hypothetical protein
MPVSCLYIPGEQPLFILYSNAKLARLVKPYCFSIPKVALVVELDDKANSRHPPLSNAQIVRRILPSPT